MKQAKIINQRPKSRKVDGPRTDVKSFMRKLREQMRKENQDASYKKD